MNHNKNLTHLAQVLRKNMTKEEKRLWYDFLRDHPYRFRRQVTVGNYILDFYCAEVQLAIELDGSQHYTPENRIKDEERTSFLMTKGVRVIRFTNLDVLKNFEDVCKQIDIEIEHLTHRHLTHR